VILVDKTHTYCSLVRAPKTATKRVFLVTNVDDPHPGARADRYKTTAQTTLADLAAAGAQVEPFFISPFDVSKFYGVNDCIYRIYSIRL
jgi:hypothetical protein